MAQVKPVKVITDLVTQKQVIKQDISGNVLFRISGTLEDGYVSSSLPISASDLYIANKIYPDLNIIADVSASNAQTGQYLKRVDGKWVPADLDTTVLTSGSITGSGKLGEEIRLKDDILVTSLTSSYIQVAGAIINNPQSATPFSNTFVSASELKIIDEFPDAYSAAKYLILVKTNLNAQMAEIGVVFRGNTALAVPYAVSYTTNNMMATFTVEKDDINNSLKLFIKNETLSDFSVTMQRAYLI